jgi:hypothetical protein
MLYENDKFTLPANSKRGITDREWEIATGQRCAECKKIAIECTCPKK